MSKPLKFASLAAGAIVLGGSMATVAYAQVPRPMGPAAVGEPVGQPPAAAPAPAPAPPPAAAPPAAPPPPDAALVGNLPIPPGAKILSNESVIIGSGDNWVGRLTLNVGRDVPGAYNYFLDSFQQQGWTLQSAVRSKTSLLVFTRAGRSATIEFQPDRIFDGALVTITMAQLGTIARY
jgi:hypothetical protein